MSRGIARIGILKPEETKEKKIKFYTIPNNFPEIYDVKAIFFVYGEDGTIESRIEKVEAIKCIGDSK